MKLDPFFHQTKVTLKDVYSENRGLKEKIENPNKMIPELTEKLLKLGEKILTQDFINVCERKALAFNENTHANLDNSHLQVVIIVINGECILDGYHRSPERVFWNENGEEFLNVRENRGIKDQIEEISTFSSGIKERAMGIKELLEQLKDRYRKEYNTC